MSTQKATMIVLGVVNPQEKEALQKYTQKATPLFVQAGAKLLGRFKVQKSYIGEHIPQIVTLMEFPEMSTIEKVLESPEYQDLIPLRGKAFKQLDILAGTEL